MTKSSMTSLRRNPRGCKSGRILGQMLLLLAAIALAILLLSPLRQELLAQITFRKEKQPKTVRVLCFGDSLTAGMSPPRKKFFPYSKYLQSELEKLGNETTASSSPTSRSGSGSKRQHITYHVDYIGLPGWKTTQFLDTLDDEDHGLRPAILDYSKKNKDKPVDGQVAIILAGTNDIPGLLRSADASSGGLDEDAMVEPLAKQLFANLMQLHQAALKAGAVRTIALGIPTSAYQAKNSVAFTLVQHVNHHLRHNIKNENIVFMDFPFNIEHHGDYFAPDGLHFTLEGYQSMGAALAPIVHKAVEGWLADQDRNKKR